MSMGPDAAASALAGYLDAVVPAHLAALRAAVSVGADVLPDPRVVTSAELSNLGVENWPAILAVPERLESLDLVDMDGGRPTYVATYLVGVESYVRGVGFEATGRLNRWYAAAVRSALLSSRTLRAPGASSAGPAPRVEVESIREEYAPAAEATRGRTIASSRITLRLSIEERTLIPPGTGAVADVDVDVEAVGPATPLIHPALAP